MANMSYCRFHNTNLDMQDCIGALEERSIESDEEKANATAMLKDTLDFLEREGVISGYDEEVLQAIIDQCE